ncbi:hypothetical protein [Thermocoleostomius sinensis]|uniref:Uncharacterized protein n=1 Tax=Thermocoleostomius sinensis A174 TaxID=2016057 RepID=A0A9E9C9V2_9CYAN|nr:hypothetical protein [Thermocoleostomius sinensis]WAL60092.1 hypothetical protein OXH18_23455 [Thermocoleostomius sinensis A174]
MKGFKTAGEAHTKLNELDYGAEKQHSAKQPTVRADASQFQTENKSWWYWGRVVVMAGVMSGMIAGVTGFAIWMLLSPNQPNSTDSVVESSDCSQPPLLAHQTSIRYATDGLWQRILSQSNISTPSRSLLTAVQDTCELPPLVPLNRSSDTASLKAITQQVTSGQAHFALLHHTAPLDSSNAATTQEFEYDSDLNYQVIAYDAIVVVVAFSEFFRAGTQAEESRLSIPQQLNGQITLKQLQTLYTGEDWRAPNSLQNTPVKRYVPDEPEVVEIFKQRVLSGADRNLFDDLVILSDITRSVERLPSKPEGLEEQIERLAQANLQVRTPLQMFGEILQDFENNNTLGIGFVRLSQAFNQCSVYPLAIKKHSSDHIINYIINRNRGVQVLVERNGKPITPRTDLCGSKGSYFPDKDVISSRYPLSFPLIVVYPKGETRSQVGRAVAQALRSPQGQQLLTNAGLTPIHSN